MVVPAHNAPGSPWLRFTFQNVTLRRFELASITAAASQDRCCIGQARQQGGDMFAVTAVNQRGRWLIENIDTFNGPS